MPLKYLQNQKNVVHNNENNKEFITQLIMDPLLKSKVVLQKLFSKISIALSQP